MDSDKANTDEPTQSHRERSHHTRSPKRYRTGDMKAEENERTSEKPAATQHHVTDELARNDSFAEDDTGKRSRHRQSGHRSTDNTGQSDDNWGETTSVVTGTTSVVTGTTNSEMAYAMDESKNLAKSLENSIGFNCARYVGSILAVVIGLLAFLSPIAMVVLPKLPLKNNLSEDSCSPACEGLLLSLAFKLLFLLVGSWAIFLRKPKATMPRIFVFRALILFFIFILTFAYWLFYGVRILANSEPTTYSGIVSFASSFVDALLFVHYLAVILLEIRQLQPQYVVKIVRSPDGASRSYTVGQLSVQRLAVWCLEQYYKDFEVYNPYLDFARKRRQSRTSEFKLYNLDAGASDSASSASRGPAARSHRPESNHSERYYQEIEYERRVRRRKARLMVATEEAFTNIKRMQQEQGFPVPMSAETAAQSMFPTLSRALQKYLRITRQQPRYSLENILQHLALCLSFDVSPKAFLERYLGQGSVIWNDKEYASTHVWTITCDRLLNNSTVDGLTFQLHHGNVSLLVMVRKIPHFNFTEEVLDQGKFTINLPPDTAV